STFSHNFVEGGIIGYGGGIYNIGTLNLYNSTLGDNGANGGTSGAGGGLFIAGGTVTLANTLIADSVNGDCVTTGGDIDAKYSLIRQSDIDSSCYLRNGVDGNRIGQDPQLGPLQNNGGPTLTRALANGSPAIDAGDNTLIPFQIYSDQRGVGFARIANGTV